MMELSMLPKYCFPDISKGGFKDAFLKKGLSVSGKETGKGDIVAIDFPIFQQHDS